MVRMVRIDADREIVSTVGLTASQLGVFVVARMLIASGARLRPDDGCLRAGMRMSRRRVALAVSELLESGRLVTDAEGFLSDPDPCWEIFDRGARPPEDEWAELRAAVFNRDLFTCRYCAGRGGPLECDHIVPVAQDGPSTMSNLATACRRCNRRKGARTPEQAGMVLLPQVFQ